MVRAELAGFGVELGGLRTAPWKPTGLALIGVDAAGALLDEALLACADIITLRGARGACLGRGAGPFGGLKTFDFSGWFARQALLF
jgi:hypothetical protein